MWRLLTFFLLLPFIATRMWANYGGNAMRITLFVASLTVLARVHLRTQLSSYHLRQLVNIDWRL